MVLWAMSICEQESMVDKARLQSRWATSMYQINKQRVITSDCVLYGIREIIFSLINIAGCKLQECSFTLKTLQSISYSLNYVISR